MIYTVGHKESYYEALKHARFKKPNATIKKLGKRKSFKGKPYSGGICFQTIKEAEQYIIDKQYNDFIVFGLNTSWKSNVVYCKEGYYALQKDVDIIFLEELK